MSRVGCSVAAGVACCLAAPRSAGAQAVGYQLDRFEPAPAGDAFALVEAPWYAATRWFAGGLTLDYAHDLLVAQVRDPSGNLVDAAAPIEHHTAGHLDLAASPLSRVGFTLSVPVVLAQRGTAFAGVGPSGTTAGDPRLGARVRLLGGPGAQLSLSAIGYVWIPVGVADELAGDTRVRGMARLAADGHAAERVRWAVNASFLARRTAVLAETAVPAGNTVGNEVQLAAGASYTAGKLAIGPEAILSIGVADLPPDQARATLELFGTARYQVGDRVQVGLGAGAALAGDGPPDARVLFSITYTPSPTQLVGSSFERVVVLPDEDGHVGAVEVDDGKTKTLLDKPYASTELRRQDPRARAVQSSPAAMPPRAAELAKTLPPSDRDRDGILDADDGCPDRAGAAAADPIRHGCPPAAEKVVVLPDEDGHVGAVEVDDGKTKVVLDQPYASAELGADGAVRAVPPVSPMAGRALDRKLAAIAQAMPIEDGDGDGVVDRDDACPDRAGPASPDPIRHGCPKAVERVVVVPDPDGRVGAIEVDDGKTKTLVDQAYAAVEIAPDGSVIAVSPVPRRSIDRALAAIARSLPIADADQDGIAHEVDACPDRAGPASADALRHGCPKVLEKVVVLPEGGATPAGVEIGDGKQTVLLDKPYATAEVTGAGVQPAPASPPSAMVRATAALAKALPPPDRDDDNILDADDACPERAGPASPQAVRHGCPRTIEQVVVLPDENGAVGAVEVDDGTAKRVLDQAYAASEVGSDGRSRTLPAEAAEVSARFAAAMAARPPGARIILYFTARSEPVRDLTGPIDNLVAEVKAKAAYTIEVIGHTDQTGSERANVRIGLERANLIADRLVAAGVPRDRITTKSMGSKEPAVKLRNRRIVELRNRRVEIWVR